MQKGSDGSPAGVGKGWAFVFFVLLLTVLGLAWKLSSRAAPAIELTGPVKGIGLNTPINFEVHDPVHRLQRVQVELRQGARVFPILDSTLPTPRWWEFWSGVGTSHASFETRAGHRTFPELAEGRATLRITATNNSWGRFFRGGRSEVWLDLPVRFTPPRVEVLSSQHYINQGGCDLVLFKVSPGTTESGVQVGSYFFPSWPVKESAPETRFSVFAYPYNLDPKTPARIVARDEVGNETSANFNYQVFPKVFKSETIDLTDDFLARVVPPILSQATEIQEQRTLLESFLLINGHLRTLNAQQLVAFSEKTSPRFLWSQPFLQLGNSKVEASFADHRTYLYNGQVVDHQDHLGFDLAVVQHTSVVAANDGVVAHTGYLGIYGNAIIVDHGCGLASLYAHLSSLLVKPGDPVKRGQVIAHSGQTGLAGGDHLHFCVLLDGIPVNPVEWWDPHWIHDHIEAKLAPYQ